MHCPVGKAQKIHIIEICDIGNIGENILAESPGVSPFSSGTQARVPPVVIIRIFFFMVYFPAPHRPEAPQGSTSPLWVTGSPISCESTVPLNFLNSVASM